MNTVSDAAASWARQTCLVEPFDTAGRNYPGAEGDNVVTAVSVGVLVLNKYQSEEKELIISELEGSVGFFLSFLSRCSKCFEMHLHVIQRFFN